MVQIASLHVYPIKSCKGIQVSSAHITHTGFNWDRAFVVIDEATGKFETQRQPKGRRLALVRVELPQEALDADPSEPLPPDIAMRVTAPGMDTLEVALDPPAEDTVIRDSTVWEWSGPAADAGDAAAAWFSKFMGKPARLVRYIGRADGSGAAAEDPRRRPTKQDWAPGKEIAFADQMPYLLTSEESLEDLNQRLPEAIPMNRFRPNIVVSGAGTPWSEDAWRSLAIGAAGSAAVDFDATTPCSRCPVPTIDQDTAVPDKQRQPTETMQKFRNGTQLGFAQSTGEKTFKHAVFFGQMLATRQLGGTISVGDHVSVNAVFDTARDGTVDWQKGLNSSRPTAPMAEAGPAGWAGAAAGRQPAAMWSPEAGDSALAAAARPRRAPHALPLRPLGPGGALLSGRQLPSRSQVVGAAAQLLLSRGSAAPARAL